VLHNGGVDLTLERRSSECLCFRHKRGNAGGEIIVVESGSGETFDEKSVFSQYQNCVNSRTLSERAREISDVGHLWEKDLRS
jgi:hypothetical protein